MKKIIKILSLLVTIVTLGFLIFSYRQTTRLKTELVKTATELQKRSEDLFATLDSHIEALENRFLKLNEQGFVEKDEFSDVSKKVLGATVMITSAKEVTRLSPAGEVVVVKEGSDSGTIGTGFLVRNNGTIATAKHVVESIGQENLIVKFSDGKQLPAAVVTMDENSDVALVKVEKNNTPFVEFGHDENLEVGAEVGFVGFAPHAGIVRPLVHRGVVSAKGTDAKGAKIFTINAFVNKGNSGGPVFSAKTGRVLGALSARQRDISSDKFINLPPGYTSGLKLGGIDPLQFSVDLYNQTLKVVGDVSQIGIGIVYSAEEIKKLSSDGK